MLNQKLLSLVLRRRGELLEVPVQFLSLSPEKVRRTTVADGLRALLTALLWRVRRGAGIPGAPFPPSA